LARGHGDARALTERLLTILCARDSTLKEAERVARDALVRWPHFVPAHLALGAIGLARGSNRDAAACYLQVLELTEQAEDAEPAVRSGLIAARLLRDREPDRAAAVYERVLQRRPEIIEAVNALAERYSAAQKWGDLARLYRGRLSAASGSSNRAKEHVRLGTLYLDQLGDAAQARAELERAVELDPAQLPAWEALARSLRELGEIGSELHALEQVAQLLHALGDAPGEARTLVQIAARCEQMGELAQAEARYRAAVELNPAELEAMERLGELAARGGRKEEAIAAYRRLVETHPIPADRRRRGERELLRLLIEVGDLPQARVYFERAKGELAPESLMRLAELEESAGRLAAAVEVLERAAANSETPNATALHLWRARLYGALGRTDEFLAALEFAHCLDPQRDEGVEAALQLAAAARARDDVAAEARWLDAIMAVASGAAQRPAEWQRRAELFLASGDPSSARVLVNALHRAGIDSAGTRVLSAKIAGALGDDLAHAALLEHLAEETPDAAQQRQFRCQAVEARLRGGDTSTAVSAARTLALDAPTDPFVMRILATALWQSGVWEEMVDLYRRLLPTAEPRERVEYARRIGVGLERHGGKEESMRAYRAVIEMPEAEGETLIACFRRLADLYEAVGDTNGAIETLLELADDTRSGELGSDRAEHRRHAAELMYRRRRSPNEAIAQLEAALTSDPGHVRTLDTLEMIYAELGDDQRVAATLGRKIKAAANDPDRQKMLLSRLGELQSTVLGQTDSARQAFRLALRLDPSFPPALRFLGGDALKRGDTAEAAAHYARLATSTAHPSSGLPAGDTAEVCEERASARIALAKLAFEDGDEARADQELGAAADQAVRGGLLDLLSELEQLSEERQRFAVLDYILSRHGEILEDPTARLALERRRVTLLLDAIGDAGRAFAVASAAFARAPADVALCVLRIKAAAAAGDPDRCVEAVESLLTLDAVALPSPTELLALADAVGAPAAALALAERAAEQAGSSPARAQALRIAAQNAEHLGRLDEAATHLETLRREGDADDRELRRLAALHSARGRSHAAARLLSDVLSRQVVELERSGTPAADTLIETLQALRAAADAASDLRPLAEGLVAAGSLADHYDAAGYFREGAILWRQLDDLPRAIDALKRAFAARPGDPLVMADLEVLLREQYDLVGLLEAYGTYVAQLPETARGPVYEAMGRLCGEELGDQVRAQIYIDLARGATAPQRTAAPSRGRSSKAEIALLQRTLEEMPLDQPQRRAELLYQLGEAHLAQGDRGLAEDLYLKAIDLDSDHAPTLRRLIDYYWSAHDLGGVAELAAELERLDALLVEQTPALSLARVALARALGGEEKDARELLAAVGPRGATDLASALSDLARGSSDAPALLSLAGRLCGSSGPSFEAVRSALAQAGDPALLRLLSPLGAKKP
jgi:tetratricopeptide (TPR) repeat protein